MALARWQQTIVDDAGNVQPLASVEVRRDVPGQPLVSLYSDRDGATPISNPFTADAEGFAAFHTPGGPLKITATLGGFSRTLRYVAVGTAGEKDESDLSVQVGVGFTFDTGTTDADPGAGELRLNHATVASVTAAYIDNVNRLGSTVSAWLDTFDDSGASANRGLLHVFSNFAPGEVFGLFRVTGSVVDGTGYRKLTLVYVAGLGTFTAGEPVSVNFYPCGATGLDGTDAGVRWLFDSSTSMADPDTGDVRLNHGTLSSVTAAAISDLCGETGNANLSAWVLTFDDSTNTVKGTLVLRKISAPQNFAVFHVTGLTDNSGWTQLALTYIAHSGSFSNTDVLSVQFAPAGNVGVDGVTAGIRWNFDSSTTTAADPGTGDIRFNNATLASVTELSISDLIGSTGNPDASAFVLSWDDAGSSPYGLLHVKKSGAEENFVIFNVTAINDQSGYTRVTVTHVASAGSFSAADALSVLFIKGGSGGAGAGNGQNALINGAMRVAQRGTSFISTGGANNDDVYVLDRWNLLSDGNDIVDVTQATDVPAGALFSMGLDVETVNKKFGILQIVEQKNCADLLGQTVTLSAYLKVTNTTRLDKVKMAIVAWDGTADAVTSDIISAWGADGTNPTLVSNWTYENTPADLGVTTSWARYSVSAAVDTAAAKNIGVFIWSDNVTDTDLGDFLYVSNVKLELGSAPTAFQTPSIVYELDECLRYYVRLSASGGGTRVANGFATATTTAAILFPNLKLRATPTVAGSSGLTIAYNNTNTAVTGTALNWSGSTLQVTFTVAAVLTLGQAAQLRLDLTTDYFEIMAEL